MPRPLIILLAIIVVILIVLFGLSMLDRPVPVTHVERALTNASAQ
ncbi:hypothetical protein FHS31_001364 [Sphingomonas vulcanisoli]|uniref:Uncharacterized protein n=1 Tax=Sphingomonas vulcanisoli TaxID=1658060 RepID=A0ABX0TSN8_9SPHN|nr:hypothetical protein [Sphingomonas vulcanisoli]NIJ07754.1 hypothetical protein [Sphingomonas vulcanisoli]